MIVVLTGGIGSGKTAVSDEFSKLGVDIIDTDVIARQVVEPGTVGYQKLREHFGDSILQNDGSLDRRALRQIVFSDQNEKVWLESTLHPLIRQESSEQIKHSESPYCIVVIPLFTEKSSFLPFKRVLVVDADPTLQIERTQKRDNTSSEAAQAIVNQQASREARLKLADDVIENNGSLAELHAKVKELHKKYLALA